MENVKPIQFVAIEGLAGPPDCGLKNATSGFRVERADQMTTLPPNSSIEQRRIYQKRMTVLHKSDILLK